MFNDSNTIIAIPKTIKNKKTQLLGSSKYVSPRVTENSRNKAIPMR
jgi:hypothetical protein